MIIQQVKQNSIAHQIGIQIGDRLETINNHNINDIID